MAPADESAISAVAFLELGPRVSQEVEDVLVNLDRADD
jgi:hypothetical protein